MRRMILALALAAFVAALAVGNVADPGGPKAFAEASVRSVPETPDYFVLLHDGDHVRVLFRKAAGPGSIRFLSLSDRSRLDIIHPEAGAEKYVFSKEQGWQTYPHDVAWRMVTIILRETGDNVSTAQLPGCSDVVVRIEGAAILSPNHADAGGPHVKCEVCGAVLGW